MVRQSTFLLTLLIVAGTLVGCSSDKGAQTTTSGDSSVVARVGDWELTSADLDAIIAAMPPDKQKEYDNPGGRVEIVETMIEEELYHQEALKAGIQNDKRLKKELENYERRLLIQEYYKRRIEPEAKPTEQEMHDFYEANVDAYTIEPIARAQHILSKNRERLLEFKQLIESGEEKMTALAHKYSEDALTRDDGGNLGYFQPGGYIKGMGYGSEVSQIVFTMKKGEITDPIRVKNGWSIVRLNELRPEKLREFEDVRRDIESSFIQRNITGVKKRHFEKLREQYDVENLLADQWKLTQRTPEELWNLAQTSSDSHHRLRTYQEIVDRYPDSELAAQALFMIGFVQAEELKDRVEAGRAFNRVVLEYPDAEIAQTAQWMLDNIDKPLPEFEDLDDLKEQTGGSE